MVETKAFLANPLYQDMYPDVENMTLVPLTKRMGIIVSIHVSFISQMILDYRENYGKKSFSCKSKASILHISMWKT